MRRIAPLLFCLCFAAAATAQDDGVHGAYNQAKKLRPADRKAYAAEQAARFAGTTAAKDQVYLGCLWSYAGEWTKAAEAFDAYLRGVPDANPKNRVIVMVERARALIEAKAWSDVPEAVKTFRTEFPGDRQLSNMLFYLGRAQRAQGRVEEALQSFTEGAPNSELAAYEAVDTLVQLGKYDEAGKAAAALPESGRAASIRKALPNLGKPMPELPIGHWAGKPDQPASLAGKPLLLSFWTTKVGKARDEIHKLSNHWAQEHGEKLLVVGATFYQHFDPVTMKQNAEMSAQEENGMVDAWQTEYYLKYPLAVFADAAVFHLCGVDTEKPVLPCFAAADKEGRLRYVRVVDGEWAAEAVDAMLKRLAAE
jgi:hypothetical protein